LVTNDLRLYRYVPTAALYFGTLLGIFLLARACFDAPVACLAVALFGLSDQGTFFASSLWPRGHPFFFVWMVYWLRRWITGESAGALAVALMFWAAGMYVFMEIAPAVLLIPVLWYVFRPPLRFVPLTVALIAAVSLWSPYLLYERTRDFRDLRALLARKPVYPTGFPENYRQAWCNPGLSMTSDRSSSEDTRVAGDAEGGSSRNSLLFRMADLGYGGLQKWHAIVGNAVWGMEGAFPPRLPASVALLLGSVASLIALALSSVRARRWAAPDRPARQPALCNWFGLALLAIGLTAGVLLPRLFSEDGALEPATRDALFWLQTDVLLVALLLLGFKHLGSWLKRLADAMAIGPASESTSLTFIALALGVPWAGLLLITEPGRAERFWWLWPLHAIVLAALALYVLKRLAFHPVIRYGATVLILLIVCVTESNVDGLRSWSRDGWAGVDSDEMRAVEYLANRLREQREARIGYQISFLGWVPKLHSIDPRYKVGAEMDLLFNYRYGLVNATQCAEGTAPDDQFRIVEIDPAAASQIGTDRFNLPPDSRFTPIHEVGHLRIVERVGPE